ncbi:MAG: response regulator transcription factor [Flavobacteriales bacterium]|nr:response regulator transcription factor [Flavobacteriales bacterium]
MSEHVNGTLTVALADDHDLMRAGIADLLERHARYRVVLHARDGRELVRALEGGAEAALAIVDLRMPDMDGIAVLEWLRAHRPGVRTLVYTWDTSEATVMHCYRNGADGVLFKDEVPEKLLTALDTVAAGGIYHSAFSQRVLLENPDGLTAEERRRNRLLAQISTRQLEVLQRICRADDPTYEVIAQELGLSRRTVEKHVGELMALFGVHSKTALALSAVRVGLMELGR